MTEKTKISDKTKISIGITVIAILITLLAFYHFTQQPRYETQTINVYLKDGYTTYYEYSGTMAGFDIGLASTGDRMTVNIILDGTTLYSKQSVYDVQFQWTTNTAFHAVTIYLENPSFLGLGLSSTILVTGQITIRH